MQHSEEALQAVRESRLLIDRYDSWLLGEIMPYLGQRLVEIGCGLGNLLRRLTDRELVIGIEPSSVTAADVRRQFAQFDNVSVYELSITDPSVLRLGESAFDSVVSLNVFEHIEDDELALRHAASLLKPSGHLVLVVPAHQWLYGTMDSSIGHYRRYTKAVVREKLERAGFAIVHQKYLNMLGAIGWFVNGRLLRRQIPPLGQLRLFNLIAPFLRVAEQAFQPPFGISLVTVAQRKPEAG